MAAPVFFYIPIAPFPNIWYNVDRYLTSNYAVVMEEIHSTVESLLYRNTYKKWVSMNEACDRSDFRGKLRL